MAQLDDVVTDRRITPGPTPRPALARADEGAGDVAGRVLVLASGGSSGPRGVFVLDPPTCRQFFGSLLARARGPAPRHRRPPPGAALAMVRRVAGARHRRRVVADGRRRAAVLLRAVPVTLPLPEMVERLNAISPPCSTAIRRCWPSWPPSSAPAGCASARGWSPARARRCSRSCAPSIRGGFGVPVVDTFGSTEGLVGSSPPDDDVLVFAEDGCIVELVDADDRPVPPGTPSAAVLVTSLENRLQPLIRYRMTDTLRRAAPGRGTATCGPGSRAGRTRCCVRRRCSCTRWSSGRCWCTHPRSWTTGSARLPRGIAIKCWPRAAPMPSRARAGPRRGARRRRTAGSRGDGGPRRRPAAGLLAPASCAGSCPLS